MANYFTRISSMLDVGTADKAICALDIRCDRDVEVQAGGGPHA